MQVSSHAAGPAAVPAEPPVAASRLYRAVWRWHFYAGLLVIPVIIVLSVTGALYLFRAELDHLFYRSLLTVDRPADGATMQPPSRLIAVAAQAVPGGIVTRYLSPGSPTASAEVGVKDAAGEAISVYVDPYTGAVLGRLTDRLKLMKVVRKIHGELMIGTVGDRIVELAACWTLILTVTGLYLWWPRKSGIRGVLLPRMQGGRIMWKDLHAVCGFYIAGFLIFLVVSGLPWSGYWGKKLTEIANKTGTGYPAQIWDDVPLSSVPTGAKISAPWTLEQAPMPLSNQPAAETSPIGIDQVVALAAARQVKPGYEVTLPDGPTGVYTVSLFPNDPADDVTLHIDQYSGKVLADLRFDQFGLIAKPVEYGVALHMGGYFGRANQLILLAVCLALIGSCVTAVVMWWQRRPAGRLGAPPLPRNLKLAKGLVVLIAAFGIALPLAGLSLVAVLLIDWLVVQRVPVLRTVLN